MLVESNSKCHNARTENSRDDFETPVYIPKLIEKKLKIKFTLDAAASKKNRICIKFYSKKTNGLPQNWEGETVWLNPPYNNKKEWLEKALKEGLKENTIVVVLIPVATSTEYFRKLCWKAKKILFVQGRIQFLLDGKPIINKKGKKTGNNLDSMILVFDGNNPGKPDFELFYHKTSDLIKYECDIMGFL